MVKDRSRNITRDGANSGVPNYNSCPPPYLNRKDTDVKSGILPDHELSRLSNINVDSDYKKWQEWQANAKRARNVQDDDFQHPSSFVGKDYTNLQTYSDALSKDQVWNGR
ncbi:Hypothetical predicted protein [Olea europaea subsp. europaea]|uniref:Uncharacterized protein n=1 Tax=Olea europaea subsp. europaea TaxID=158383 RepID=A0A8S0PMN1_OLEEU|nr:Hypothetical predicted protein [Olea europaea subsp. europaea]